MIGQSFRWARAGRVLLPALVLAFTLLPFLAFAAQGLSSGKGAAALIAALASPSTKAALGFSLAQAGLSALLALVVGMPGAWLVASYKFPGRKFLLALSAVPFCLPPLLVVLAFVLYYGREGWLARAFSALGLGERGYGGLLYSFWGLVFVHAFYNFPIVVQNVGSLWGRMPRSREEAARSLGAPRLKAFAAGTLPHLLPAILQSTSLIFLFCFFSFTIVLVFGGLSGSTLEVGIYRALRFSADKPAALVLSLVQTGAALLVVLAFSAFDARATKAARDFGAAPPLSRPSGGATVLLFLYGSAIVVFFLGPVFALALEAFTVRASLAGGASLGFGNFARLLSAPGAPLVKALLNSLALSGGAALAATAIGLAVGAASRPRAARADSARSGGRRAAAGLLLSLPLALSPAVVASGWSSLFPEGGRILIAIGQAATAWPFVARSLAGAFSALDLRKREAALVLGAGPSRAALLVELPTILPSCLGAAAFAFSLTMGDANIPLVLGGGGSETLPILLYRLSSSYRFGEACAVGLVLAAFTSLAFFMKGGQDELS